MVYAFSFSYWAWLGTIYLLWMTWQDVFRGNRIDDRKNWFMLGLTVSLYSHLNVAWWFLFVILGVVIGVNFLINKTGFFAKGDTNAFNWLFIGFALLTTVLPGLFFVYFLWLISFSVIWFLISKFIQWRLGIEGNLRLAFFPVILTSFITTCLVYGLF